MSESHLPLPLRYLLAARRAELRGLEALADTCTLVHLVSHWIHALQKERGYASLYLGCPGEADWRTLETLMQTSRTCETDVRAGLDALAPEAVHEAGRARLLTGIADVLYRADALPRLRRAIREATTDTQHSTEAYSGLIAALLTVVFEAADTALDPEITRALAALFNFLQGKELSGQERACGTAGFGAGYFDDTRQATLRQLVASQQRYFAAFVQVADAAALAHWAPIVAGDAELQMLREMAWRTSPEQRVDPSLAPLWFERQTQRIDAMKTIDAMLADALLQRSRDRLADTRRELENHRILSRQLADGSASRNAGKAHGSPVTAGNDTLDTDGEPMRRSLRDLVQRQGERLQQLGQERDQARAALTERKAIDAAKAWLIRHHQMSESAAHAWLQRAAMARGEPVAGIAQALLAQAAQRRGLAGVPGLDDMKPRASCPGAC